MSLRKALVWLPVQTILRSAGFSWFRVAIALIAGGLQALSLAWPLDFKTSIFQFLGLNYGQPVWWLQLLALLVLCWMLAHLENKGDKVWPLAALWAWLFSTAWLTGTIGWTFVAMHTYAGLPFVLAALAVLTLASLLALIYAAVCALFSLTAYVGKGLSAVVFASFWLLAELIRGTLFTGFGWGAIGYAHVDGPLAGFIPWVGVYGLGAAAAWLAMTLVRVIRIRPGLRSGRQQAVNLVAVIAVLAFPVGGKWLAPEMTQSTGHLSVTLLQGNIPQDEKFERGGGIPIALQWYAEQLQKSRTSLVIAPETALPVLPQQLPPTYWAALIDRFARGQQAALIGTPLGNFKQGYTNSVVGLKPDQAQAWQYDKFHLVPFGEFIPPFFKWFTQMMNIPLGDFNRGTLAQAPFEWQGQKLAPNICYENLFSEELAANFRNAAQAPTIFVNISNLAWFGQSMAMDQHLQIARMRALEFERPFVLATNTGISAIVNHQGRIVAQMPRDTRGVLVGDVEGRSGATPYAWLIGHGGLWPFWGVVMAVIVFRMRRR